MPHFLVRYAHLLQALNGARSLDTADFTASDFECCCSCGLQSQDALILAVQNIRTAWGQPMTIDCGARCPTHNAEVGGAKDSAHLYGLAADIRDVDGSLKAWIEPQLETLGLWMEHPHYTPTWLHVQVRPAQHRVFIP